MITGLSENTFQNIQLNEGAFFVGLDYKTATDAKTLLALLKTERKTKCLGATIGGGSFTATPETRQIEADGMRYPVIGSTVIDSWEVKLTGTMKEVTAANIARVLATAGTPKKEGNITTISVRTDVKTEDYIPSIVWVGTMAADKVLLIDLKNALNLTGMNLTFADKGEGSLPFEFKAHCATLEEMENAPFVINIFENAA